MGGIELFVDDEVGVVVDAADCSAAQQGESLREAASVKIGRGAGSNAAVECEGQGRDSGTALFVGEKGLGEEQSLPGRSKRLWA